MMRYRFGQGFAAILACAALAAADVAKAQEAAAPAMAASDPTVPAFAVAERLGAAAILSQKLEALVVADDDGVALLDGRLVRKGSSIPCDVGGMKVEFSVAAVSPRGVSIVQAHSNAAATLVPSCSPGATLQPPESAPPEFLRHLECEQAPLGSLLRMISDQTGANIALSDSLRNRKISLFLRNVTAEDAVEEICRALDILYRREPKSRIIRVMTRAEFAEGLNSFREEATEMFTLMYPNVVEMASVIYGLWPDRTFISLGEEEFDEDDENDLSRRFRRFRQLEENGGSQFMAMDAPQTSSSGTRSGSGVFSFSRGSAASRQSQWDQLRRRLRTEAAAGADGLSADDAALLARAYSSGDTNAVERLRAGVAASANIFVSLSRRNNMLVVRTSDTRVMDEIRSLVKRLDVPTPMVLMEVKVLELDITDGYEASFSYSFNRDTHTAGHDGSVSALASQAAKDAFTPTFAFSVVNSTIDAQVRLLQQDGKIRTLATPSLLVANNEVARIFSGKEYPLVTGWKPNETIITDGIGATASMTVEITKQDVGTMLLITPNINADKTVTLRLVQENSEVSPTKVDIPVDGGSGESKQIEYVESRSLAGTFVAKDGMTIMAGGLVKEQEGETYWRTPFLGSLPLVGWLFRGTEKIKQRSELIVLIKPHVITTPVEGGRISSELMRELSAHPAADGSPSMGTHLPDERHSPADDVRNIVR